MVYKKYIEDFVDFPKEGIVFKDISSLIARPVVFDSLIKEMAEKVSSLEFNTIVALDARGFVFGSALAFYLSKSLVMARKKGKLPGKVTSATYILEYGEDSLEIQQDKVDGRKVLIVDDLPATGGTLKATVEAVKNSGGTIVGALTAIELTELSGREALKDIKVMSVIKY